MPTDELTRRALEDYTTAPISERLRSTLGFLKKLTLSPSEVTADDVRPLLALGLSKEAVRDAIYVCFLFNTYDRLADALGWEIPSEASFAASAQHLIKRGYV